MFYTLREVLLGLDICQTDTNQSKDFWDPEFILLFTNNYKNIRESGHFTVMKVTTER